MDYSARSFLAIALGCVGILFITLFCSETSWIVKSGYSYTIFPFDRSSQNPIDSLPGRDDFTVLRIDRNGVVARKTGTKNERFQSICGFWIDQVAEWRNKIAQKQKVQSFYASLERSGTGVSIL